MNRDLPIFLAVIVVMLASLLEPKLIPAAGADNRVAGVVSAVEADRRQVEVRTENGEVWRATANHDAMLKQLPLQGAPGPARTIAFGDIAIGSRVHLHGQASHAGKTIAATRVLMLEPGDAGVVRPQRAD